MVTRTSTQCRSHAQKFIVSLEKQGKNLENVLEKNDFSLLCNDALANVDDLIGSENESEQNSKKYKFKK